MSEFYAFLHALSSEIELMARGLSLGKALKGPFQVGKTFYNLITNPFLKFLNC